MDNRGVLNKTCPQSSLTFIFTMAV